MTDWVEETLHDDFRIKLKADKVLFDSQTDFQRIVVFENASFGRVLTLDDVVQTTEGDEFIYHEMLAHVPVLAHGAARRVLIVGGGDGGMLEEVLKHRDIETVTQVEIDQGVIDLSKQYLGSICGDAFEDPRTHVVIADGVKYLADCDQRYDVVIIDSTDPIGPGEALFTKDFYASCHRALTPGGILVTQNGVPFLQSGELTNSVRYMADIFADASCYMATVPTYVGGPMAFGWASDNADLRRTPADTLRQRFAAAGFTTRYYTPEVHAAAFALPGYVAELIA